MTTKHATYLRGLLHGALAVVAAYVLSQWYADHVALVRLIDWLSQMQAAR